MKRFILALAAFAALSANAATLDPAAVAFVKACTPRNVIPNWNGTMSGCMYRNRANDELVMWETGEVMTVSEQKTTPKTGRRNAAQTITPTRK